MARRPRRDPDDTDDDKPTKRPTDKAASRYWFGPAPVVGKMPPQVYGTVYEHAVWLQGRDQVARLKGRIHEALYENQPLSPGGEYAQAISLLKSKGFRPSRLNVARSIVDTWQAKISKRRPIITVSADDAEWSFLLRAQQLTKFIAAKNRETDFDRTRREILKDVGIDGNGILAVGKEFGEIVADRVYREEMLVDPRECRYGKPRNLYRVRRASRDVITEMVADAYKGSPLAAEMIAMVREAPESTPRHDAWGYDEGEYTSDGRVANQIDIYEAWHLSASPDTCDGRFSMNLTTGTLFYEEWKRPRFPFAFMRRAVPKKKFWGTGYVELVGEQQYQINQTVRSIQENLYYGSTLRVMVPRNSVASKNHLVGRHPHYIEYDPVAGGKPEYIVPDAINEHHVAWLEKQIQLAYDISGISMLSAASKNPIGAGASGVAFDTFYDIESERFGPDEATYTDFTLDASELYVDTAKEIYDERSKITDAKLRRPYTAVYIDKTHTEKIDWDEVDMSRDQFKLIPEPTNFIPQTRGGKLAAVEQLTKAGIFDQYDAAQLFDEPDVAHAFRMKNSLRNNLERCREILINPKKYPNTAAAGCYVDENMLTQPGVAKELSIAWYNDAQARRAPEEVLQRIRDWQVQLKQVEDQLSDARAAMAPPAPGPGMPPAGPAPMPMDPAMAAQGGLPMPLPPSPVPGAPPVAPIIQG
jgi:hypothetical protein